ncbi:MAG: hypothetical protein EXS16_11110 [Gemmataceae bacterium]|nr:hypothetical protein [Gemmataceae bacterium]
MSDVKYHSNSGGDLNTEIIMGMSAPREVKDDTPPDDLPNIAISEPTAFEVFIAWEKLRLIYNAVLILVVAWVLHPVGIVVLSPFLIEDAGIANGCYCAGIVAEGYLAWWGVPRVIGRLLLFGIGTVGASVEAFRRSHLLLANLRD